MPDILRGRSSRALVIVVAAAVLGLVGVLGVAMLRGVGDSPLGRADAPFARAADFTLPTLERIALGVAEYYHSEPGIAMHSRAARSAGADWNYHQRQFPTLGTRNVRLPGLQSPDLSAGVVESSGPWHGAAWLSGARHRAGHVG